MISLKYVSLSDNLILLPATVQLMSLLLDYYKKLLLKFINDEIDNNNYLHLLCYS